LLKGNPKNDKKKAMTAEEAREASMEKHLKQLQEIEELIALASSRGWTRITYPNHLESGTLSWLIANEYSIVQRYDGKYAISWA
jgi:hypothetical protein